MAGVNREWRYQRRWSPSGINDDLHIMILHISFVRVANHLREN